MAGRLNKPILPIFLDETPIPDEFLYYLSIHQAIKHGEQDWAPRLTASLSRWSKPRRQAAELLFSSAREGRPKIAKAKKRAKGGWSLLAGLLGLSWLTLAAATPFTPVGADIAIAAETVRAAFYAVEGLFLGRGA